MHIQLKGVLCNAKKCVKSSVCQLFPTCIEPCGAGMPSGTSKTLTRLPLLASCRNIVKETEYACTHTVCFTVQISLWTAGVVVCTLLINAPLLPPLLRLTGLTKVPPVKAKIRATAASALLKYSQQALRDLQHDPHEMLRGKSCVTFSSSHPFCQVWAFTVLQCLSNGRRTYSMLVLR